MSPDSTSSLRLASDEVPPVLEENDRGTSPFLFTCDHYGRLIPRALGQLGLPVDELTRHIAWDIGIAGVATALSRMLNAHLIAQRYSRLVIDCNRPPGAPSSIPMISEATMIPGNEGLTRDGADDRRRLFFEPYHRRIDEVIDQRLRERRPTILVSLHSFTPVYAGIARPWHVGTLYHRDVRLPPLLLQHLRAEGDLVVGDNEPYSGRDGHGYSIKAHAEALGLAHALLEIRQDLIADERGQERWADILHRVLKDVLADPALHQIQRQPGAT